MCQSQLAATWASTELVGKRRLKPEKNSYEIKECNPDHQGRNTMLVIAKTLVRWTLFEERQRGAVPANLHHVFDHAHDYLVFALFSLETFAKLVDDGFSKCFSGALREGAGEPVSIRVFDTKWHGVPGFLLVTQR